MGERKVQDGRQKPRALLVQAASGWHWKEIKVCPCDELHTVVACPKLCVWNLLLANLRFSPRQNGQNVFPIHLTHLIASHGVSSSLGSPLGSARLFPRAASGGLKGWLAKRRQQWAIERFLTKAGPLAKLACWRQSRN